MTIKGISQHLPRWRRTSLGIRSLLARLWRLWATDPVAFLAIAFILAVVVSGLLAEQISPYGPNEQNILGRLAPPSWGSGHLLGTDALGRDLFARLLYGTRLAVLIPSVGTGISLVLGVTLGLVAGYFEGKADAIIMRVVDQQMAFSTFLLILVVVAMIGPGTQTLMLVFGLANWVIYARIVRGALLSLREAPYVQAARVIGCSDQRILVVHLLPNLVGVLISIATVEMARLMVAEAGLSFLGFGAQPPTVTWGLLLAEGRAYLTVAGWLVTFPGLYMAATVLAFSLAGNWLREITSPYRVDLKEKIRGTPLTRP